MDESRDFYAQLGKRLAALRAEKGLSQVELARETGMKQTTYSGYESGARRLPLDLLPVLCRALGASPEALLSQDGGTAAACSPEEREVLQALRLCQDPAAAAQAVVALLRLCR